MRAWKAVPKWVWWASVVGLACACTLLYNTASKRTLHYSTVSKYTPLRGYNTVSFTTVNATRGSYTRLMEALRDQLASGYDERHTIPVLRESSTVPASQRFLLVELSNWGGASVTLALDVTNAYVVAYRAGEESYFLRDAPDVAFSNLFTNTLQRTLGFNGSYVELEGRAGEGRTRENIGLGIPALEQAISSLRRTSVEQEDVLARSLIVAVQMVSEAARFKYIEQRVRQSIGTAAGGGDQNFCPDAGMLSLENNWGALSTAIQESNDDGVFGSDRRVQLQRPDYSRFYVDRVTPIIIINLALMKFMCSSNRASSDQHFSPLILIRFLIDADDVDDDDDTCAHPEPTTRISGRNGLCVDVRDAQYNDGNPIQLWPCKSNTDANQLWTLKRDGTIQSNGKCLTTYGSSPGCYVMIYDCTIAVPEATRWEVFDNGTIINPTSALVLSAGSGNGGTILTVETDLYASRQAWRPSNNTDPFVTSIIGFMDLCLETTTGTDVLVGNCGSGKVAGQEWAIYADGSIRPQQNQDRCLSTAGNSDQHLGADFIIVVSSCSPGSSGQRWVFTNDGAILNPNLRLVMDVKEADPSLEQIILWPFTGNPNQKWLPML